MSGKGSRFAAKGYKKIKPCVEVFEKPIIKYIVEKFSNQDNFIFICREEHLSNKKYDLKNYLETLAPNTTVISVENHKLGPVYSLLQISKYINNDDELIVNYCDFDWRWNYSDFKEWISVEKPDAALCVYSGFHPHYINPAPYAYTRNHQHNLLEIKEKESFTKYREEEPAASGTFYFSSGKLLLESCNWLVKNDQKINGEFYVSLLFNYFPSRKIRTLTYFIKHFMQWGTPDDLEEFIFFAKKVPLNFKPQLVECPSLVLMAGKGTRMKSIDETKKPYLRIDKSTLFQICTKNFKSIKTNLFAINGDDEDKKRSHLFKESETVIVGQTISSVETLYASIMQSNFSSDDDLLVLPCDAAIDLDWKKFLLAIRKIKKCEAIIFSFSGYPYARWTPNQYGWLELNEDKSIKNIGYKKGWDLNYKNPIITGHFWFSNIGKLKENLKKFLNSSTKDDRDSSIDEFCAYLINSNNQLFSYPVNDFLCLGTSFEFRAYEYWIKANEISKLH